MSRVVKVANGEGFCKEELDSCSTCNKINCQKLLLDESWRYVKNSMCGECGRKPSCRLSIVNTKSCGKEKSYGCDLCGREFSRKCNLIVHFKIHTGEKDYTCKFCGKKFAHSNTLSVHYRVHTGERNYGCHVCKRKFAHKSNLNAHIKTHDPKRPKSFPSKLCGEVFHTNSGLSNHAQSHILGAGSLVGTSVSMYGHMNTQDGQRVFICKLCNKSFVKRIYLRNHLKIHTGEKKFICEYCGKRFSQNNHLMVHTTIHTGLKKYGCGDCGKRFAQKSHLRVHARTHTGEKNFECGQCGKRFSIKSHLNYHIRVHTGEKNFACEVCGKKFTQNSARTQHMKSHYIDPNEKPKSWRHRGRRRNTVKSEILESDLCQERFVDRVKLHEHQQCHANATDTLKKLFDASGIDQLNSSSSVADMKSVVEETHNVVNHILPVNGSLTGDTIAVKTEENSETLDANDHDQAFAKASHGDLHGFIKEENEDTTEFY